MYKHIVFDVDGTLINTEYAILHSLKDTLKEILNKDYKTTDLEFALGTTGEAALKKLGISDIHKTLNLWDDNMKKYTDLISIFDKTEELLTHLLPEYKLGIVTSKTKSEFKQEKKLIELKKYFEIIVCADDTKKHKPDPEPLLKYLELANVKNEEILYIGDSIYDMMCAESSRIDFAFAKWGNKRQNLKAKYTLLNPLELLKYL